MNKCRSCIKRSPSCAHHEVVRGSGVFDVQVTVRHEKFLIIKPTRCTNFSNLFLDWNSTCFGQFLCPSSGVFHCTHSNGICHTDLLAASRILILLAAVSKPVWHKPLLCVQWKTPDDGQRNCPKHVEFQSKNKFEKLLHLVRFIIRRKKKKGGGVKLHAFETSALDGGQGTALHHGRFNPGEGAPCTH